MLAKLAVWVLTGCALWAAGSVALGVAVGASWLLIPLGFCCWLAWQLLPSGSGSPVEDDSQYPDLPSAAEESEANLQRIMAEEPARRQRRLQAHYDAMEAAQPAAYATYRCSNSMCRHIERQLTWHNNHECENCGWSMYREVAR